MNNCMGLALSLEKSMIYTYSAYVAHVYHISYLLICATYIYVCLHQISYLLHMHTGVYEVIGEICEL